MGELTITAFPWNNSHLVRDAAAEVPALKNRFLLVFPVLIGTGKRLFGSGTVPAAMTLVRSTTTLAGVLFSVYRRAGALRTGSFELPAA